MKYTLKSIKRPKMTPTGGGYEELYRMMARLKPNEALQAEVGAEDMLRFRAAVYAHNNRTGLRISVRKVASKNGKVTLVLVSDDCTTKRGPKLGSRNDGGEA